MRIRAMLWGCSLILSMSGCGANVADPEEPPDDVELGDSKSRWSFELPDEGTPNDNGNIGPFCCTGVTAVVTADDGEPLGYGYFFDWQGQAYNSGGTAFAPDFVIHLSAAPDLEAPPPPIAQYETGDIAFSAGELSSGVARSADVGALHFTATIEHVDVEEWEVGPMFDMGTLTVRLDVDPREGE